MKRILIISLVTLIGLGSFAQSFVVDTTFQPFFDIRAQRGAIINGIYEDSLSGRLYAVGGATAFNNFIFGNIITCDSSGSVSLPFSHQAGIGSGISKIEQISSNRFATFSSGSVGFINRVGSTNMPFSNWFSNRINSVRCPSGTALVFSDGSSLFTNGRDNTGKACKIIQGTDTFLGRHIIKLTPQELWDSTFNHDATYGNPIGFVPYDSNRIIIYGNPFRFTHYDSIPIEGMCGIYLDGTLDTTFTSPVNLNFLWGSLRPQIADK